MSRDGEKYTEALEVTGLAYQTLANCKLQASRFEFSRRRESLPWAQGASIIMSVDRFLDGAPCRRTLSDAQKGNVTPHG